MSFFDKKNAGSCKLKEVLELKSISSETTKVHMSVCLRTKFQGSCIILTSFKQREGILPTPHPHPKMNP